LKTFFTQTGPSLPLMSDPPVIYFWKWIGWEDYRGPKNRNLESVSAKNAILLSPPRVYPPIYTHRAHPTSHPDPTPASCTAVVLTPSMSSVFEKTPPFSLQMALSSRRESRDDASVPFS
jgi:hypothetical protein